jgi:succinate dehydrogenase assembly factor 2
LTIAKPRSEEIYAKHVAPINLQNIPAGSFAMDLSNAQSTSNENVLNVRRKRLIYRSKQRGWLEVDLLLGTWASENVPYLNAQELDQFEDFVNEETIDIFNIITLRLDVPEEKKTADGNSIIERIQAWARGSPLGKADPAAYKKIKMDNSLT